ncbi:hypothetical protein ACET3X_001477 [Alternaria dauci]|uniref:Glutathione S-transferase n=1 Tax=Alternaria dauci TaxID=48095 RepID=A0ABR3UXG7_9PLEO
MGLTVHHLQHSQSERIVWLCEELGIDYELKIYQRERIGLGAPANLKAIHPTGTAPVIQDGDITMSESAAIMDYLLGKHGNGALSVSSSAPNFSDYVFWYHWGIGTFQSTAMTLVYFVKAGVEETHPIVQVLIQKRTSGLDMVNQRLMQSTWLAGEEFTAADVYTVFVVTTMRLFTPFSLSGYSGIKRWLENVSHRPAYRRLIEKAEQGESRGEFPVLGDEAPRPMASY